MIAAVFHKPRQTLGLVAAPTPALTAAPAAVPTPEPTTTPVGALPHPNRYSTRVVASTKMLPKTREAATWGV